MTENTPARRSLPRSVTLNENNLRVCKNDSGQEAFYVRVVDGRSPPHALWTSSKPLAKSEMNSLESSLMSWSGLANGCYTATLASSGPARYIVSYDRGRVRSAMPPIVILTKQIVHLNKNFCYVQPRNEDPLHELWTDKGPLVNSTFSNKMNSLEQSIMSRDGLTKGRYAAKLVKGGPNGRPRRYQVFEIDVGILFVVHGNGSTCQADGTCIRTSAPFPATSGQPWFRQDIADGTFDWLRVDAYGESKALWTPRGALIVAFGGNAQNDIDHGVIRREDLTNGQYVAIPQVLPKEKGTSFIVNKVPVPGIGKPSVSDRLTRPSGSSTPTGPASRGQTEKREASLQRVPASNPQGLPEVIWLNTKNVSNTTHLNVYLAGRNVDFPLWTSDGRTIINSMTGTIKDDPSIMTWDELTSGKYVGKLTRPSIGATAGYTVVESKMLTKIPRLAKWRFGFK